MEEQVTDQEEKKKKETSTIAREFSRDAPPILHLLVVGFHHKKGCQVEYSYPPLCPNSPSESHECPEMWKNLPSLAMPDGSHNFVEDTVYFHLPSMAHPGKTVYGVSSYRQIEAKMLSKKTADITRSTVQKAVCVLSNLPLYGHIQVKMGLITEAYFREGDFTQFMLLHDAYNNLNMCLNPDLLNSTQAIIGLPLREMLERFGHKVVQLFKLILLQKRVLFFHSPVRPLSTSILAMLALFPGVVESGLDNCTALASQPEIIIAETLEVPKQFIPPPDEEPADKLAGSTKSADTPTVDATDDSKVSRESSFEDLRAPTAQEMENEKSGRISPSIVAGLPNEDCGLPLQLFGNGYVCHPYLSLSYLDLLSEPNIRGYIVGATNVLFKQKKTLFDAIIELETGRIDITDPELRRQLELTKEDMRFADHIVRLVVQDRTSNTFLDGVGWEGGDEWLRAEFKTYLLFMLRTSLMDDGCKYLDEFNPAFIQAWKATSNYAKWLETPHPAVLELHPGHMFSGQLSISDVKLKISQITQTMQNTEKGRKISNAAASTSRAVANTSKVVGGAISQAKGAFSSWWSTFHQQPTEATEEAEEALGPNGMRMSDIDLTE
ncbi:late secretory pathway protein AVL9 homolog isoform X2 [Daphnia pulicaria]|uniref:late secretory pathway protein AVL9 homolog isoform X2 n=1 Tax=Daphnia pulicaria TaxID=35523 RepID=UPI001EECEB7D|nr:late secretory pathway protein AVL9 homolog isoform X2 [Daphnia pulicaria]